MRADSLQVIQLTHSLSRHAGGLFYSVRRLAQSVSGLDVNTSVAGLWDEYYETDRQAWLPLVPHAFRAYCPRRLGFAPSMIRHLGGACSPETVVHLHGLWKATSFASLWCRRRHGAPIIVSPRGMLGPWCLNLSRRKKRIARWVYEDANLREAACLHALSPVELAQIRDFGLRNPVAVIPNGMDIPPVGATAEDPVPEWKDNKVALFLSRLHPVKGLDNLIPAFVESGMAGQGWRLAIAGPDEGGYAATLESMIGGLGATESIRMVGSKYGEEKDAWLHRADLFLLPSLSEGSAMALLEALAYGLPSLVTEACNFPEAERAGAAVTVPAGRGPLADGLRRVSGMTDEELHPMGCRGRELIASRFAWTAMAERMLAVYRWVLGRGSPPDCVDLI